VFEARCDSQVVMVLSHAPHLLQGFDVYKHFDRILTKKMILLKTCMPAKIKAVHVCLTESGKCIYEFVAPVLKYIVGQDYRLHMTLHVSCYVRGSRIRYISA
jgi:hypothetical protein